MATKSKTKSKVNYWSKVYQLVQQVPVGKVTTYGNLAKELNVASGVSANAKMVGWALHSNKDSNVACHRVVDRNGRLAPNFAFDGAKEQRRRLEVEGVKFVDEMHVDLEKCLWGLRFQRVKESKRQSI